MTGKYVNFNSILFKIKNKILCVTKRDKCINYNVMWKFR